MCLKKHFDADFSLIRAAKADKFGNLIYNKTAQNFNPMMAAAGKFTIAEVEEIVETGDLDPADDSYTKHLCARTSASTTRKTN